MGISPGRCGTSVQVTPRQRVRQALEHALLLRKAVPAPIQVHALAGEKQNW